MGGGSGGFGTSQGGGGLAKINLPFQKSTREEAAKATAAAGEVCLKCKWRRQNINKCQTKPHNKLDEQCEEWGKLGKNGKPRWQGATQRAVDEFVVAAEPRAVEGLAADRRCHRRAAVRLAVERRQPHAKSPPWPNTTRAPR